MTQRARPFRDSSTNLWNPKPIYPEIGEVVTDDSTFVSTPNEPQNDTFICQLTPILPPRPGPQILYVRMRGVGALVNLQVTFSLLQGTRTIASQTLLGLPGAFTTYAIVLSPDQIASITDYGSLRVLVTATGQGCNGDGSSSSSGRTASSSSSRSGGSSSSSKSSSKSSSSQSTTSSVGSSSSAGGPCCVIGVPSVVHVTTSGGSGSCNPGNFTMNWQQVQNAWSGTDALGDTWKLNCCNVGQAGGDGSGMGYCLTPSARWLINQSPHNGTCNPLFVEWICTGQFACSGTTISVTITQ